MGRRAKPAKVKAKAKRPLSGKPLKSEGSKVRDLEKRLAEALEQLPKRHDELAEALKREASALELLQTRDRELAESQEQQTAASDILRVISSSPTDLQPVFNAIAERAVRLCEANDAEIYRVDGQVYRRVAHRGPVPIAGPLGEAYPLSRGWPSSRAIIDRQTIHIHDLAAQIDTEYPDLKAWRDVTGVRTILATPLLREGVAVGVILIRRTEINPFSDTHIELLRTFANQAVIAIENVRLFKELEQRNSDLIESLARQMATSEVLRVISQSPTDLQPVFDTIAENARRLLRGYGGLVVRFDGQLLHVAGMRSGRGSSEDAIRARFPMPPSQDNFSGAVIFDRDVKQIADIETDDRWVSLREHARRGGWRANLGVPMMHNGQPIGVISVTRREPGGFTEDEIVLLQTFADQAVIAIENVRLFTETKEALERQTATAGILKVISSSPTDVQPVFDAIAESAFRLLSCAVTGVLLRVGDGFRLVAMHSGDQTVGLPPSPEYVPIDPAANFPSRVFLGQEMLHIPDWSAIDLPVHERGVYEGMGVRSSLMLPMLREGNCVGVLFVGRASVRAYTDKEIELLQSFVDQAMIAIENVRLFNETKEALEQQTATAEILRVISASPTDIQPVFDAVLDRALTLCEASHGSLYQLEGGAFRHVAARGTFMIGFAVGEVIPLESAPGRAVLEKRPLHIEDALQDLDWVAPEAQAGVRRTGVRTYVAVPLLREQTAIGAILIRRLEVRPFSEKQIRLLQTFADQAVIAIENVRLFTELQTSNRDLTTALDTQTATADILRVISRSRTDVQPVFDAIVTSAVRLLGLHASAVTRVIGDKLELVALTSTGAEGDASLRATFPISIDSEVIHARVVRERVLFNFTDAQNDPALHENVRATSRARGYRSLALVPLLRRDEAIGAIGVTRREPGGFDADEIALLQTFADQAVIAIENVRLFTELETRNSELTSALDQQTATGEILRVIARSPRDTQPVFETIVRNAVDLCGASQGGVYRFDGELVHSVAHAGYTPEQLAHWRTTFPRSLVPGDPLATAIRTRTATLIRDIETETGGWLRAEVLASMRARGSRSVVTVPMMREGAVIGLIILAHREVDGFSEAKVELLRTFAEQAVIAIENVRLFTELQTSNRELTTALDTQTATSDILRVISRSQTDIQPVFDAILGSAARLLKSYSTGLTQVVSDRLQLTAFTNTDPTGDAFMRAHFPLSLDSDDIHCQAVRDRAPVVVTDVETDLQLSNGSRAYGRARGWRSAVVVPMLRHGEALGSIGVSRREAGDFTADEIGLLETFADQAVIAIENARLLTELQARTHELTRSVDQLTVLGEVGRAVSSTLDLETVLTTIVSRAVELSGMDGGVVFEYDEAQEAFIQRAATEQGGPLAEARRATWIAKGEGVVGRTAITLEPVQVPDISIPGAYESRLRDTLIASGVRAILAVPMMREDRLIGNLVVTRNRPGEFLSGTIELLRTFATQSALAIQNARLFRELEIKSRELEVASQHKSEFLASMSHELRTPLNAVIGFSDVLLQGMFGETNEKQTEYLRDILASGQHLLSLINDILDLSKIEAGRMDLDVAPFDLPSAIDDAMLLMRERAGRRGITLERHVDERVGEIQADQRKVKQVLLNLVSNAVKFTPEGGRIEVRAGFIDGTVEISVTDTGIGIAPEDHDAVFEEFRQVGKADKKAEGTGLGLALCRKFVELHGGRIWVKSEMGAGSTFTFTVPIGRSESDQSG